MTHDIAEKSIQSIVSAGVLLLKPDNLIELNKGFFSDKDRIDLTRSNVKIVARSNSTQIEQTDENEKDIIKV